MNDGTEKLRHTMWIFVGLAISIFIFGSFVVMFSPNNYKPKKGTVTTIDLQFEGETTFDVYKYLKEQTEPSEAALTDEDGNTVTDEEGNPVTGEEGNTVTDEDGNKVTAQNDEENTPDENISTEEEQ